MKKEYLRTLILAVVTVLFSLLVMIIDKKAIGPNGTTVGWALLNGFFHKLFPLNKLFYTLTNLLGYFAILVCAGFGAIGALQLIKGRSLKKVDRNIIALGVLYVITIALYIIFDKVALNYRPVIMPGETEPEASFPSSHTMLAMVVFCSAPMVLKKYIKNPQHMKITTIVCYALAAVTVVGRLISGVHWFTDILASILISATLLSAFENVLDLIKPKKKAR